jgi:hypothetical protein
VTADTGRPDPLAQLAALAEESDIHKIRTLPTWQVLALVEQAQAQVAELEGESTQLSRVREAVGRHPNPCPERPDRDVITCGWKRAVIDVRYALRGERRKGEDAMTADTERPAE